MKGQHEVLTLIVITGVLLAIVVSVWLWATPIIEASKDNFRLRTTEDFTKDLSNAIKLVAKNGGKVDLKVSGLDPQGTILVDSEGIDIITNTRNTIYEKNIQIPLGELSCATTEATWGLNSSDVICVKSDSFGKDITRTIFSLRFIQLDYNKPNDQTKNAYKIMLLPLTPASGLNKNSVLIENKGLQQNDSSGRTLISTLVAISIV